MMEALKQFSPQTFCRFLFLASAAVLGGALYFQYVEGLAPCKLCIWQRYPHGAVLILTAVSFVKQDWSRPVIVLCAVALAICAGIAFYHVGVEQHWWANVITCAPTTTPDSLEGILEQLENPPVACDQIPWSLFGISMAGYNALLCLGLAGLSAWFLKIKK